MTGRIDASATILTAGVMAAAALGWAPFAPVPLGMLLAVALLWFASRAALGRQRPFRGQQAAAGTAVYRALLTLVAGWVLASAAGHGSSPTDHPAHQLGVIIVDLGAAIVLLITAAGWLLATFAMPAETRSKPVARLAGITEALLAAGLAVALYAIS